MKMWWNRRGLSGKLTIAAAGIMSIFWLLVSSLIVWHTANDIWRDAFYFAKDRVQSVYAEFEDLVPYTDWNGTREPGILKDYLDPSIDPAVLAEHDRIIYSHVGSEPYFDAYAHTTRITYSTDPYWYNRATDPFYGPHFLLAIHGGEADAFPYRRYLILDDFPLETIKEILALDISGRNGQYIVTATGYDAGFYFYPKTLTINSQTYVSTSASTNDDTYTGTFLYTSPQGVSTKQLNWFYNQIEKDLENSYGYLWSSHPHWGELFYYETGYAQYHSYDYAFIVETEVMATPLLTALQTHAVDLLIFSFACVLLLLWFYRFARRIAARPIREAAEKAGVLSSEKLGALALDESRNDEIGALNRSLNAMASRLHEQWMHERELERQRQEFLAAASHDLKTPLALIGGSAEAIEQEIDPDGTARYLATIGRECGQMSDLVTKMLDASRLGQMSYLENTESFFLGLLVGRLIDARAVLFGQRTVKQQLEPFIRIEGDETALGRAIGAILDNAAQYSAPDAAIEIKLTRKASGWRLTIENEGAPIAANDLPRLFELFYRADRARARENGSGIGLAVAARVFDLHDLTYRAENTEIGVCFTVETHDNPAENQGGAK